MRTLFGSNKIAAHRALAAPSSPERGPLGWRCPGSGLWLIVALLGLLSGCATDVGSCRAPVGDRSLTPARAAALELAPGGWQTWGGSLVRTEHRAETTELELVAYPLSDCGRPRLDASSIGRFIVTVPGYLETADLRPGQPLTATGPLIGMRDGEVGSAPYRFPLLEDPAPRLWPEPAARGWPSRPVVNIGIGAGSGGWRGGGVGISF